MNLEYLYSKISNLKMKKKLQKPNYYFIQFICMWVLVFYSIPFFSKVKSEPIGTVSLETSNNVISADSSSQKSVIFISEGTIVFDNKNIPTKKIDNRKTSKISKVLKDNNRARNSSKVYSNCEFDSKVKILNIKQGVPPQNFFLSYLKDFIAIITFDNYRIKSSFLWIEINPYYISFISLSLFFISVSFLANIIKDYKLNVLFSRPPPLMFNVF